MYLLDVNVVLASHRADHPHHIPVRRWFDDVLAGDEPFTVPVTVWASFLRLAALLRTVSDEADALGDLVPDAVLAALALEHSCTVATLDRDFARFRSIRHELLPV